MRDQLVLIVSETVFRAGLSVSLCHVIHIKVGGYCWSQHKRAQVQLSYTVAFQPECLVHSHFVVVGVIYIPLDLYAKPMFALAVMFTFESMTDKASHKGLSRDPLPFLPQVLQ